MVVVMDVIIYACFKFSNAIWWCDMKILGFWYAEEALNYRVVKAVPLATHPLLDSTLRKHRSIGLHLVVPASFGVNDQPCVHSVRESATCSVLANSS